MEKVKQMGETAIHIYLSFAQFLLDVIVAMWYIFVGIVDKAFHLTYCVLLGAGSFLLLVILLNLFVAFLRLFIC